MEEGSSAAWEEFPGGSFPPLCEHSTVKQQIQLGRRTQLLTLASVVLRVELKVWTRRFHILWVSTVVCFWFSRGWPRKPRISPWLLHSFHNSYFSFSRNFDEERTLDCLWGGGFHPVLSWATWDRPRMAVCHVVADWTGKFQHCLEKNQFLRSPEGFFPLNLCNKCRWFLHF